MTCRYVLLTESEKKRMQDLRDSGLTLKQISLVTGRSISAVYAHTLNPKKKNARAIEKRNRQIYIFHKAGMSTNKIHKMYNLHYTTIQRIIEKYEKEHSK